MWSFSFVSRSVAEESLRDRKFTMEEDHSASEERTPRAKVAKRKAPGDADNSSAAKRARRDATGTYFARAKNHEKKIAQLAKKYERPGASLRFKVCRVLDFAAFFSR